MQAIDLELFLAGYIECALWSSYDNSDDNGGDPLDDNYDEEDLAEETMARMRKDCQAFIEMNETDLLLYSTRYDGEDFPSTAAGHDFWLSRNGHGSGFWDRGLGELGDRL